MQRARHATADPAPVNGGAATPSAPAWRHLLADAIRDPDELCALLALPDGCREPARRAAARFPLLVPRGFAALMRRGDPSDPLLRQVLPIADEDAEVVGYGPDPVGEGACSPLPGLLRKYHGRALLVTTGACAVHCRYCFRRSYPYDNLPRGRAWWAPAVAALRADQEVREVILSGGDPLTLPDGVLGALVDDLAAIPQLDRLRVHSRLPVVLPERVDDGMLGWLVGGRLRPVLVIHANHAGEMSPAVAAACERLRTAGVTLLNQSVLLRGVNDRVELLEELSGRLFACGVLPYYLHQLDRVAGAAHFAVDEARARQIHAGLAARLPGYLVPRLVREEPGHPAKRVLA